MIGPECCIVVQFWIRIQAPNLQDQFNHYQLRLPLITLEYGDLVVAKLTFCPAPYFSDCGSQVYQKLEFWAIITTLENNSEKSICT